MALTVKRITLWRADVEDAPGVLARTLEPLAHAGADLRLVMGYHFPHTPGRSAIEVYPVNGRRVTEAAQQVGLAPSSVPCLLVEGDDRAGLGSVLGRALADAGINVAFLMAAVAGRRFTAAVGFADDATARAAAPVIKKAARTAAGTRKRARRR